MYHLIKLVESDDGGSALKGISAKTEKELLNKGLKCGLITELEKTAYKHGQPCLTVMQAPTYEQALNELLQRFEAAGYGHIELKD